MGDKLQLHTSGKSTAENPFTFVVDLGEVCTANRLVLYSQSRSDPCIPKSLLLYASTDGVEYTLVKTFTDVALSGNSLIFDFDDTELRYYKIALSGSTHSGGYIIIRELEMWHMFGVDGGNHIAPDNAMFTYAGAWLGVQANSSFGHIYKAGANASMSFEFTGTRVGFISSSAYGRAFEVYIDGKKCESVKLKTVGGAFGLSYLCGELAEGTHTVEFKCTAEANVDSVVIFP